MAFLISARPPSSPTMNRFSTLVSYSGVRLGMSAPTLVPPITIVMAPTGHASAQSSWPMHLYPFTMTALPPSIARTSPSGHTLVQVWQPMQALGASLAANAGVGVDVRVLRLRPFGKEPALLRRLAGLY